MKITVCTAILFFQIPVMAGVLAQERALRLAQWTLSEIYHAEAALIQATESHDAALIREDVSLRLRRVQIRWQQAPYLTDLDKSAYDACLSTAMNLREMSLAVLRGDNEGMQYIKLRYREGLATCKDEITNTQNLARQSGESGI